jgi:hypothetical protein
VNRESKIYCKVTNKYSQQNASTGIHFSMLLSSRQHLNFATLYSVICGKKLHINDKITSPQRTAGVYARFSALTVISKLTYILFCSQHNLPHITTVSIFIEITYSQLIMLFIIPRLHSFQEIIRNMRMLLVVKILDIHH